MGYALESAVSLVASVDESSETLFEFGPLEEMVHAESRATGFGGVGRSDSFAGGADGGAAELDLLESVDDLVKVENEMSAVGEE